MKNDFKIGNYVILRGNCSYNRNVGTGKTDVLLCHGRYSCDEAERDADLVIIKEPVRRLVKYRTYRDERIQDVEEWKSMVRVLSTKTRNVYEVDTAWANSFSKEEYHAHLMFTNLMAAMHDALDEQRENEPEEGYDDYPW